MLLSPLLLLSACTLTEDGTIETTCDELSTCDSIEDGGVVYVERRAEATTGTGEWRAALINGYGELIEEWTGQGVPGPIAYDKTSSTVYLAINDSVRILRDNIPPAVPDIPGVQNAPSLDSTSLLELDRLPETLIFLGGGYIGVELAQMMARMGTRVTIVCRSRLLPRTEPEVAQALTEALRAEGVTVLDGATYHAARRDGDRAVMTVTVNGARRDLTADRLVLTTGRAPNTDGMGLAEMGVETDARGAIRIGDDMQTTKPGIFAAGDVTDRDQFVYMAAYGAKLAARNAVLGGAERYDNAAMPWVVFTDPQVAGVGLTEAQARAVGHDVKTSVLTLDNVPRALAARDTRGLIKLVADRATDRLLGGVIMAPEGADSVQTLAMALKVGMTTKALGETIFPYLTTVEGLKLAAQTFDMDVAKLSCCAG